MNWVEFCITAVLMAIGMLVAERFGRSKGYVEGFEAHNKAIWKIAMKQKSKVK